MAADSLTAPVPGAAADRDRQGPGWREERRSEVHWGLAHGLPRLAMRAAARRGDLQGRLMVAASSGDQVWELLAEARASGPLHRSRLAYLTVDHAVVKEVLSSPDFRAARPYEIPQAGHPGLHGTSSRAATGAGAGDRP